MSRLASKPIEFDSAVQVTLQPEGVKVKGPKGELTIPCPAGITVRVDGHKVFVERADDLKKNFQGLAWSLIRNAIVGVTKGYSKKLEIVGKGWRSTVKGKTINLQVGHSHVVDFALPEGVSATQENPGGFTLHASDKHLLGQVCANIQKLRPVEPYKLKGIRREGQRLRQKVRKTAGV